MKEGHFSEQVIEALVEVVTGGPGMTSGYEPVGHYRTGPELEAFLGDSGIPISIGSRVPSVREALKEANKREGGYSSLVHLMEKVSSPREYIDEPHKGWAVVKYLNERLYYDDLELRLVGKLYKLAPLHNGSGVASKLQDAAHYLDWGSVSQDLLDAQQDAEEAPYRALSSACSTLESVCKSLLDEMGRPYPQNEALGPLCNEVQKYLGVSPARADFPSEIEQDVKRVLGGLISVSGGIASLRTHASGAHGKGKDDPRPSIDPRIAHLAIDAISTLGVFYLRTWQKRVEKD